MSLPPTVDPWARFRASTRARIGIGRVGDAIPTNEVLDLQFAHARARDAVHGAVDFARLAAELAPLRSVRIYSLAVGRSTYLARPDLGRRVDPAALASLPSTGCDICFVIADGLSASAVEGHALPVLKACLKRLSKFKIGRVVFADQARVALADEVGERMKARLSVILIGERPGLSVPDSLGAYLTYGPRVGRRDSERNCVSNIHADGLSYEAAADKIAWLAREALRLGLTGVDLKDEAMVQLPGADEKRIGG